MSDCILWTGSVTPQGYGRGGRRLAHRVAWELDNGPIPTGRVIHHRCGVRLCVNPEHLVCLTHAEHNAEHGWGNAWGASRRRAVTHCPQGHEYTPENTKLKRGKRHCRECMREQARAYHARNRDRILPAMRERERRRRAEKRAA